jgi:5-methylcytosine-specific restriction endonuclease McrA
LLLNATYGPLSVLSVCRAAKLLLRERAEPVAADSVSLVGQNEMPRVPTVLRLRIHVNVPRRNPPMWTRRGMLARDQYMCAYCGKRCSEGEAT